MDIKNILYEVKVTYIQTLDKVALVWLKHSNFLLTESNGFISKFVPFALHIFDRLIYIVNKFTIRNPRRMIILKRLV